METLKSLVNKGKLDFCLECLFTTIVLLTTFYSLSIISTPI